MIRGNQRSALATVALLLTSAWLTTAVTAATFSLNPMRIELSAKSRTGILNVSNNGDTPLTVRIKALTWTQPDGVDDTFGESRDFIINPPILTVPPGGRQMVRIASRHVVPGPVEKSYRLAIAETAGGSAAVSTDGQAALRLRVAVTMNIPLIVGSTNPQAAPVPAFELVRGAQGQWRLRVSNTGDAHLRLLELALLRDEQVLVGDQAIAVVPGATRYIELPEAMPPSGTALQIRATSNGGPVAFAVSVPGP